jgi:FkbM family methyltransferase
VRLRAQLKYLAYTLVPGMAGAMPYFGTKLYFPPGSLAIREICRQGIFEEDNLRLAASLAKLNSVIYDVGANIGQSAAPLLSLRSDIEVVSFEPSPSSLPFLRKTVAASPHAKRWRLVETALGARPGAVGFQLASPQESLFEGTVHTGRSSHGSTVQVEQTTLDQAWIDQGRPPVSLVKVDTEGGETEVLAGAGRLIAEARPAWLIEWSRLNLAARGIPTASLLDLCRANGLIAYASPGLTRIDSATLLDAALAFTESFLLLPSEPIQTEPTA